MKHVRPLALLAVFAAACSDPASPRVDPAGIPERPSSSQDPVAARGGPPEFVPNEVVVRFRAGVTQSRREAALARASANVQERIVTNAMRGAGDARGSLSRARRWPFPVPSRRCAATQT
jgi:hypothetical protein